MNLDKKSLKQLVEQSKPSEIVVLQVNSLEKNSLKICQKEIDKFIKKQEDYVITVIKRQRMFKITPLKYSIVERRQFWKDDKEVNCGVLWKWGFTLFTEKPEFLKDYDPKIGVILGDQQEFDGGDYSDGDEVYFHSDNVTEEELEEVKNIFQNMDGNEYYEETEWSWGDNTTVMFGELKVKEVENWYDQRKTLSTQYELMMT